MRTHARLSVSGPLVSRRRHRVAVVAATCALALVTSSCGGDPVGGDAALFGHFEDVSPQVGIEFLHVRSRADLLLFEDGRYLWGTLGRPAEHGFWRRTGDGGRRLVLVRSREPGTVAPGDTGSRIVTAEGDSLRIRYVPYTTTDSATVVMRRRPAGTQSLPDGRWSLALLDGRPAPRSDTVTVVSGTDTIRRILTLRNDELTVVAGVLAQRSYTWEQRFERVRGTGRAELQSSTSATRTNLWGKLLFVRPDSVHWVSFQAAGATIFGFAVPEQDSFRVLEGTDVLARRADFGGIRADVRLRRVR